MPPISLLFLYSGKRMEQIHITLPDGSVKDVPKGTTPADVARSISPRLADAALVARVAAPTDGEGELVDLRRPLDRDVKLQILTEKDPTSFFFFRPPAAHCLAAAVRDLYPNVKLGIAPPIDTGFFYEFLREEPFTTEDLAKIEKKMHELAAQDLPNERKLIPKPEALDLYKKNNQIFKCELVEEKATEPMVSFYTTGKFIDFCRGPHIPSTKRIQAFKLMNVAGAYWKGQEGKPQLQRIYAVAFFTQKELDEHLHRIEEAKRRDHRKLGVELDLFSIQEEAGPGLIFWHPKGGLIRKIVEDWLREELLKRGYAQDDAHIFCMPSQIESEVEACVDFAFAVMKNFGFDKFEVELSDWDPAHPQNYAGKPEDWHRATAALADTMKRMNVPYKKMEGEAAFYGPKIDVKLIDAIGRSWQLTTVQFDFNLPARFGLQYVGEDGSKHQPLMVHRALLGSVERFFGILIEHYAGAFPLWLAPVQVEVCPVSEKVADYAKHVTEALKRHNLRVHLDDRNEKLPAKIRDAQLQKIPYMLVVGPKEAEASSVSVRHRSKGDLGPKPLAELVEALQREVDSRATS